MCNKLVSLVLTDMMMLYRYITPIIHRTWGNKQSSKGNLYHAA